MSELSTSSETSVGQSDLNVAAELQLLVTEVALLKQEIEGDALVKSTAAVASSTQNPIDSCVTIIN